MERMKMMKKVRRTAQGCAELIRMQWQEGKSIFFMDILIGLLRESRSILTMVFPAVVIQLIADFEDMDQVLLAVFVFSLLLCLISTGTEIVQRALSNHSVRAVNHLLLALNRCAMKLDLERFEQNETMEKYDKAYDGIYEAHDVHYHIFATLFSKLISFGITFYIFSTVHWLVAVMVAATLLIEFAIRVKTNERLHQKDQEQSKLRHKINYISDTLFDSRNNKDILLNGARDFFYHKYEEAFDGTLRIEKEKKKTEYREDIADGGIGFIRTTAIYVCAVCRYMAGMLSIANFTLFANAAKQMTYAIWQIMQVFQELLRAGDYLEDYRQYADMLEEREQGEEKMPTDGMPCIEFRNVSFRYPNQERYALRNVSFVVHGGQTVALIGDNGAGKSTIVKLLLRLYHATEGDILLNGKSIYSYDYKEYLSYFAPVFQDYMMYSFTVRENLLFDRSMEEKELMALLENIGLGDRIRRLPEGLDTPYTKRFYENGVEFSGGEEQKLAIVRGCAKGGEILVLDEPTAAIDPIAEYNIYRMLFRLRSGHTTFFVSHRMSTTRFCDRLLVFSEGELRQDGSHEELMQEDGLYARMYSVQMQYYKR